MIDFTNKPLLISIVGPTAVGKTDVAIQLAQKMNTEIISADSRQFYIEMTIGTAKPTQHELALVPHHFINSHTINESYSAGEFGRDAIKKISELHIAYNTMLAVGGSGLYLKAIWEGFDDMPKIDPSVRNELNKQFEREGIDKLVEELREKDLVYYEEVDLKNAQRIIRALEVIRGTGKSFSYFRKRKKNEMPYSHLKIGLNLERSVLFEKINHRMDVMIEQGLFEEAEKLYDYRDHNALQTVGYSEIFGYMEGRYDKTEAIRLLKRNSRRYAKRQLTWFKKYDDIHWFSPHEMDKIHKLIERTLR